MHESALQKKIVNAMEGEGWFVTKLIQTSTNGIPDLLCLKDGRAIFIEVKADKGKVNALQYYRHRQLSKQGFEVYVVNNFEQVKDII